MKITGLILAGGRGTRMGSVDKGLVPFRGQPMVAEVLHRLAPQVDSLMINANQNIAEYEAFGHPVWPDQTGDFAGPMAGIQSGLMHCTTPYLVTVPCDCPFLPHDLVQRLTDELQRCDADIAIAVTGMGAQRQSHPVFALLKTSLLPDLDRFLQKDGHKMLAWFASHAMAKVLFEDEAAFDNLNTQADLQRYDPPAEP